MRGKALFVLPLIAVCLTVTADAQDDFSSVGLPPERWTWYDKAVELIDSNDEETGVRLLQIKLFSPFTTRRTRTNHLAFTCQESAAPTVEFTTYPANLHMLSAPINYVSFRFDMSEAWVPERWNFEDGRTGRSGLRSEDWNLFNRVTQSNFIKIKITRRGHISLFLNAKYARPLLQEFKKRCRSHSVKSKAVPVPPTPNERYKEAVGKCIPGGGGEMHSRV